VFFNNINSPFYKTLAILLFFSLIKTEAGIFKVFVALSNIAPNSKNTLGGKSRAILKANPNLSS
jgi:hypothetical protein